jgi:hypothetical protein
MEDKTSTTPSLPSFLRQASLSPFGQRLRKSFVLRSRNFPYVIVLRYCMRRRAACELITLVPQHSRNLHAVRSFGHSYDGGRVHCALHVLDDVVRWYRYRDRE